MDDFEELITGERREGLKKIIEQQGEVDKQSLIEISDKMCKDIRKKTGVTVYMVSIKKMNSYNSTLNVCQETDNGSVSVLARSFCDIFCKKTKKDSYVVLLGKARS